MADRRRPTLELTVSRPSGAELGPCYAPGRSRAGARTTFDEAWQGDGRDVEHPDRVTSLTPTGPGRVTVGP